MKNIKKTASLFLVSTVIFFLQTPSLKATHIDKEISDTDIKKSPTKLRVLSIDGGGIRGLIPAIVLDHIEQKLSTKFRYDVRMSDFFDVIAGTSTGSIIGLGLLVPDEFDKYRPKYKAGKLVKLYRDEGKTIFPQDWWRTIKSLVTRKYSADALAGLLLENFQSSKISQTIQKKRIFIPSYDISHNKEFFFENGESNEKNIHANDHEMWKVARASSAAPTYFPAMVIDGIHFVDGGVFMNNPTLGVYAKGKQVFPDSKEFFILSLGTGEDQKELPEKLKDAGKLQWASHCPPVMMKGAAKATENIMDWLVASEKEKLSYYRLQPTLSEAVLDKVDEDTLQALEKAAQETIETPKFKEALGELEQFCQERVQKLEEKLKSIGEEKEVDLSYSNISGQFVSGITKQLSSSSTITYLNLTRCGISSASVKELATALKVNKTLTALNLSQNGIGYAGISYLGDLLRTNSSLKVLSLQENGIDARARQEIGALIKKDRSNEATSLTQLDLSQNRIGDRGLEAILFSFKGLSDSRFESINLEGNEIGKIYRSRYANLTGEGSKTIQKEFKLEELRKFLHESSAQFGKIELILKNNGIPEDIKSVFEVNGNFKF